jgi:hypothetical protein
VFSIIFTRHLKKFIKKYIGYYFVFLAKCHSLNNLIFLCRELKGLPYWKRLPEAEFLEFQTWLTLNNIDLGKTITGLAHIEQHRP